MFNFWGAVQIRFNKNRNKTSHCSMSTRSQLASSAGKFETQAQILAMRPKVCWRPNTTISEVLFFILVSQKRLVLSLKS